MADEHDSFFDEPAVGKPSRWSRLWWRLSAPWRSVGELLAARRDRSDQASESKPNWRARLVGTFLFPLFWVREWLQPRHVDLGEEIGAESLPAPGWRRRLLGTLLAPLWLLGWLVAQVRHWWEYTSLRNLLFGLPAVACLAVFGVAFASAGIRKKPILIAQYDSLGRSAVQRGDYYVARVVYERLIQFRPTDKDAKWYLAQCLEKDGDIEQAEVLIKELAPPDKKGYADAHIWLAQRLLAASTKTTRDLQVAEAHLKRALEDVPESIQANDLLGQLYFALEMWDRALNHYQTIQSRSPNYWISLAVIHKRLGHADQSRQYARQAVSHFSRVAQANLDDHDARLAWGFGLLLLDQFPQAIKILEEGQAASSPQRYDRPLSQVYVAWSDSLARQPDQLDDRIALLEKGMRRDPENRQIYDRLLQALRADDPASVALRERLIRLSASAKTPSAFLYLMLSVDADLTGNPEGAKHFLEQALRTNPKLPIALNNLAMALAESNPPDLPRALSLANQAVELWPQSAEVRDTRGRVLALLERDREALADLELAKPFKQNSPKFHAVIAEVYGRLGMADLAAEHARRARTPAEQAAEAVKAGLRDF